MLGNRQKGHQYASAFTGEHIERTAGCPVVHGFDPNSLVNQALKEARGGKLNAFPTAKDDQLWLKRQKFFKTGLGQAVEAVGGPGFGALDGAQNQGNQLNLSVDHDAISVIALNGKGIAGIGVEFHRGWT